MADRPMRGRLQQVTIGLAPELVDAIDARAAREDRSRAKMIELVLRDAFRHSKAASQASPTHEARKRRSA